MGVRHYEEEQADRYFAAFFDHFEQLAEQPLSYSVTDIREGYRRSVCGSGSVYYRIHEGGVEVMAIIGRQDAEQWLLCSLSDALPRRLIRCENDRLCNAWFLHGAHRWSRGYAAAYSGRSGISFGGVYRVGSRPLAGIIVRQQNVSNSVYTCLSRGKQFASHL